MSQGQKTQTTNRIPGINYTKQGNPILTDETPYQTRQSVIDSYKTLREQTTKKITELVLYLGIQIIIYNLVAFVAFDNFFILDIFYPNLAIILTAVLFGVMITLKLMFRNKD